MVFLPNDIIPCGIGHHLSGVRPPNLSLDNKSYRFCKGWATSTTPHSVTTDPAEAEALSCLEQGTQRLEEGDVQSAKTLYQRSVEIKRSASSLFNLGVTHYHLSALNPLASLIALTHSSKRSSTPPLKCGKSV